MNSPTGSKSKHGRRLRPLDGGTTDTGHPYYVMELAQGVPIIEFCDKNKLPGRERLKLFIQVCQAVQSAHLKDKLYIRTAKHLWVLREN